MLLLCFSESPSGATIDGLLHNCIGVLGYFVVILVWADLLWRWVFNPITKLASSLAPILDFVADLGQGICDLFLSLCMLFSQARKQILAFLAWVYFYPIDKDIVKETEPKESSTNQPWNDSNLWSYIESEGGEETQAEVESPTDHLTPLGPQCQALVLYRNPISRAFVPKIDSPAVCTSPTVPPQDVITLRPHPEQTYPAPRSPTITDNLNQIRKMKAEKDNPSPLPSPGARFRPTVHDRKHPDDDEEPEGYPIRTPDLDYEHRWASSSDEGDMDEEEPLVSTVVPVKLARERWAIVFKDAKDTDEELDRFEAVLGGGGS
ncbi:MAG: hypothetical protein Q9221_000841 [Calogaya cf. arnoldii]